MSDKNKHRNKLSSFVFGTEGDKEGEFIPLISDDNDEILESHEVPDELPILPLRNTVLFPGVILPITVGREKSVQLIREAYHDKRLIGTVAQKDPKIDD